MQMDGGEMTVGGESKEVLEVVEPRGVCEEMSEMAEME